MADVDTGRNTSIQLSFAEEVRELCTRLRTNGSVGALELLRDGRAIAITFDSWIKHGDPAVEVRNLTYAHALTWLSAAREELAQK